MFASGRSSITRATFEASERSQIIEGGRGDRREWTAVEVPINCTSRDYEPALRLERQALVRLIRSGSDFYIRVAPKLAVAELFMKFVWKEKDEDDEEPAD